MIVSDRAFVVVPRTAECEAGVSRVAAARHASCGNPGKKSPPPRHLIERLHLSEPKGRDTGIVWVGEAGVRASTTSRSGHAAARADRAAPYQPTPVP